MPDVLRAKLRQASRRLDANHFLNLFAWCLTATLTVGSIGVFAEKLLHRGLTTGLILVAACSAAFVASVCVAFATRKRSIDAAMELDRAFALKERVSTLVALAPEELQTPAAQALVRDVESRTADLHVPERIRIALPRFGWAPLVPLTALVLIAAFVGPLDWFGRAAAKTVPVEERQRIVDETKALEKKLAEHKKQLEQAGLDEDLKALTAKIEEATRQLSENNKLTAREAALELSDLSKAIEERRRELDAVEQMRRSLSRMPSVREGPAQELAKALKQGDFKEAAKQLQELQKKLGERGLNAKDKDKLAKQLSELEKQLKEMSNLSQRMEQLKKSLPPDQLQKELAKLAQDAERMKQLKDLAEKLGQCSKCMSETGEGKANSQELEQAMADAQQLLEELMKQDQAAELVNKLLEDLADCQGGMCQGERPGMGMGRGRGFGERPEAEDKTGAREVKAKTNLTKGPVFLAGQTEGRSFRGESIAEIRTAAATAGRAADEAITRQKVPKQYQAHTREYFDKLNGQLNR